MTRVEIPAYADAWMRGARFGVVERSSYGPNGKEIWSVRLDHPKLSKRLYRYFADDCRVI